MKVSTPSLPIISKKKEKVVIVSAYVCTPPYIKQIQIISINAVSIVSGFFILSVTKMVKYG